MKKLVILFAAAALLGFTACQSDILPTPEENGIIRFTATLGDATNPSRAIIDGDTPKWEANDQIRIYCFSDTGNVYRVATRNYTAVSQKLASGGSSTATFELSVGAENQHWVEEAMFVIANFAGSSSSSNIAADRKTISTDSDRAHIIYYTPGFNGSAWGNQDNNNVQVRVAYSYDRNLAFQNVFHLLRFTPNLSSGATKAIITRNTVGQPIARYQADVIFDSADGSILNVRPGGGNIDTLRRALVDGVNYFALDPGMTLTGGFKIELLNDLDETLQTFTYTGDFTTVRNKITTITNFDDRVVESTTAVLKDGSIFCAALKQIADGGSPSYSASNTSITSVVIDTRSAVSSGTVVSADGSVPVYANFDAGVMTLSTAANKIYFPANAQYAFYDMKGLTAITNANKLVMDNITTSAYMFWRCESLGSFGNVNLPLATNTSYMFERCSTITAIGNVNIPAAMVTSGMFKDCRELTSLGAVQMDAAQDASFMFQYCIAIPSLTLRGTDNNTLTDLRYMFASCRELTGFTDFAPVSASITNTASMFSYCDKLENVDISGLAGDLTDVSSMFYNCNVLSSISFNSGFNTEAVTDFTNMFSGCSAITSLNLSNFNTSAATSMMGMFAGCRNMTTIGATTQFTTTSSLTNTNTMFSGCAALTSVDLTALAGHLTNIGSMFQSCSSLTTIHLSNDFNTEAVSSYAYIFSSCSSLSQLYIKGFHLTKGVVGTTASELSNHLMRALYNVPTSCTIHYSTNTSSEWPVPNYLPYTTTNGSGTGGYSWTTAN